MKLKLGIGIDNIIFGATQNEIESLLGKPDRIRVDEEYGEFEPMIQYNSKQIRLTFYKKHSGKLGYIRSSNPSIEFNNKKIIGKSISEIFKIFSTIPKDNWEIEEYDFWIQYFNEGWWINLRIEYDTVSEIEMGVPFIDEENYKWPDQKANS